MTAKDLEKQAQLIFESEQKFASTVRDLSKMFDKLIEHQSSLRKYMATWRDLFASSRDLMQEQMELHKLSLEALKALSKAVTESTVSTNENNERMEKLILKVESYFGTGGLDYEN